MTRKEHIARRIELIKEIQRIADGFGELAAETDRKIKRWEELKAKHGLTRPETRCYE